MPTSYQPMIAWLRRYYLHVGVLGAGLVTWLVNLWQFSRSGAVAFFGDDTFAHLQLVSGLASGDLKLGLGHPFLFQQSVLSLSRLFHSDPVATYNQLAMLSYPLMVALIGYAAYAVFNKKPVGVLASLCLAFVSIQPVQTYQDGTIPNIFGIGVVFPIVLIGLSQLQYKKRVWVGVVISALGFGILFLTHHLSTLIALTSLALAGVLSSVWVAFRAPAQNRRFFFLPFLIVVGLILFVAFVVKPVAVISLVQLYVNFQGSYPWIHFVNTVGSREPWTAVRYGMELGGIVFQLGVVGIAMAWYDSASLRRYSQVVPRLIVTAWCIIYWWGSMTSLSGEPDRLARDFALPGSILAAYALWWCYCHLSGKGRPVLVAVLLVTLVGSLFAGSHRHQLATNKPGYLFGEIDQRVYEASAPYGSKVALYSPNYYWMSVANVRGTSFTGLDSASRVKEFMAAGGVCAIQIAYKESIARGEVDQRFVQPVYTEKDYRVERLEDDKKVIWRFCQESANPMATSSQNT